jgi:hypothetical protein
MLVRQAIRQIAESRPEVDKLIVLGDAAANAELIETLRGATQDVHPTSILLTDAEFLKENPLRLVARGAAELAKRFQEMTWGCRRPSTSNNTEAAEKLMDKL